MTTSYIPRRVSSDLRGFTLIEVVMILAIVGILAAMVGSAGLHAREKARTTSCASNLASLGQSYAMCVTESSGYLPLPYYKLVPNNAEGQRVELCNSPAEDNGGLFRFTSIDEFKCVEDDAPVSILGFNAAGREVSLCSSYGYNVFLPLCSRGADRVDNPAQTVTFYDGNLMEVVGDSPFDLDWAKPSIRYRHGGKANFLYLDGHVEQHGDFQGVQGSFALQGVDFNGTISINPNNTGTAILPEDNEFQLVLPDGRTITHEEILAGVPLAGEGFAEEYLEYEGPAVLVKIKPKSPGLSKQIQANGIVFDLPINVATVFTGALHVHLYNDMAAKKTAGKPAMGHWWISISSKKATISMEPS